MTIANYNIVSEVAGKYNVPPWIPLSIGLTESGLSNTPPTMDSNGYLSTGIFQLNQDGLGAGYDPNKLTDPYLNSDIAIKKMQPLYQTGYGLGLRGQPLVEYVANNGGWPTQQGVAWEKQHDPPVPGASYDKMSYDQKLDTNFSSIAGRYKDTTGSPAANQGNVSQTVGTDVGLVGGGNTNTVLSQIGLGKVNWWEVLIVVGGSVLAIILMYRIVTK